MSNYITTYFDSLFDEFSPISLARPTTSRLLSTTPALNITEHDDSYVITVTIPGLDEKKVTVELVDQTLTIAYSHDEENENKSGKLIRQEYSHYSFRRSITLPRDVDTASVKAKASKGILTITMKKLPEKQPQKVNIDIKD